MKRVIKGCLVPASLLIATSAMADSGPGCGLGQNVFAGKTGLANHVLAATTNGISSNQLFGLSFDSLGCNSDTVITAQFQRSVYVASNYDNLARDAAKGGGQHLQSLATLMQMNESDTQLFFAFAQSEYDTLFGTTPGDHDEWIAHLYNTLSGVPALSKYAFPTNQS